MIVYQLACADGHFFEGWFASPEAFERQATQGQLQCPTCSGATVRKLPSAPHVHTSASAPAQATSESDESAVRQKAIQALRSLILSNTENVGRQFAEIARRIHYKEEASRNIRGVATPQEADELREEGIAAHEVPAGILPTEEVH